MKTPSRLTTIRLPGDLHAKIKSHADRSGSSFNYVLCLLLERGAKGFQFSKGVKK